MSFSRSSTPSSRSCRRWLAPFLIAGTAALGGHAQAQLAPTAGDTATARPAQAASHDPLRARGLLEKAVAHFKRKGDKAFVDFARNPAYSDGELYVFVLSPRGEMLASGGPGAGLVRQNIAELKDAEGKPFVQELLQKANAKGAGTVTYKWLNRVDNKVESKVTYFQKVNGRIVAVGYYIAHATPAQAEKLLDRAVEAFRADPAKATEEFNRLRGPFSQDDLYVFAVDMKTNRFIAHGLDKRLLDGDAMALRDASGKPIVKDMVDATANQERAEIDYLWPNPVTGKIEPKHTFLRRVGDHVIGVSYYLR